MKTLDELRAHHDWLKAEIEKTRNIHDRLPLMADFEGADMELRARITEGISVERLMEMCEGDRDDRLIIRPECEKCQHRDTHKARNPCFDCIGQSRYGTEKGYYFDAAEAALQGKDTRG